MGVSAIIQDFPLKNPVIFELEQATEKEGYPVLPFKKKKKGLALSLEAIFFVIIVLIFTTGGLMGFSYLKQSSNIRVAQADMTEIAAAVSQYHYDMGYYPGSLNVLTQKASDNYHGPWLGNIKKTPWNGNYQIKIDGSGTKATRFMIYCSTKRGGNASPPGFPSAGSPDSRWNQAVDNGLYPTIYVIEH